MSDLREALEDLHHFSKAQLDRNPKMQKVIEVIVAALAKPQSDGEPVAWLVEGCGPFASRDLASLYAAPFNPPKPLYTSPPSSRMLEQPLTDAERQAIIDKGPGEKIFSVKSPSSRMRRALEYIVRQQWDENADLDDICQTAEKALRAGDNHASDTLGCMGDISPGDPANLQELLASDGKESEGGGGSRPAFKEERIEKSLTVHEDRTTSLAAVRQMAGVAPGPSDRTSPDLGPIALWPAGCLHPNTCSRYRVCMYTNCRHDQRDIRGEVAIALRGGE